MLLRFCPNPEDLGVSVGSCLITMYVGVCIGWSGVGGIRPKRVETESEKGLTKKKAEGESRYYMYASKKVAIVGLNQKERKKEVLGRWVVSV